MQYIDLIKYLIHTKESKGLFNAAKVNTESEALLIYMKDNLSLESEVFIFEIEETEDELYFEKDGVKYFQLLPVDFAIELIELDLNLKDKGCSDVEIAKRLLAYRLNDA